MSNDNTMPEMLFVVGAPRSGSSVLLDFLTVPKTVAWIPQRLGEHPEKLSLARRANKLNWPLLGEFYLERRSVWKSVPEPANGESFWSHYMHGFTPHDAEPYIPGPEQVSSEDMEKMREIIREICYMQRRQRFVAEYNGFPRIRILKSVFPKAKFIQVLRDPRSVAYQMVKRAEGANLPLWKEREKWAALMPEVLQARLKNLPDTPLNFCGVLVRWYHELYKIEMDELHEMDKMEVAYSDLLSRPDKILGKVMKFADLPQNKRFKYYVKFHDIQQSNQRTNRNLNSTEAEQLAQAVEKV
ncbi:sulfotransferase [Kiritimatiellaeota bacterium B1221]|nr:sulfotransferase [Kiritimatiellaeota bacterium B1221]